MIVDCAFRSVVPDNCALGLAPVRTLTLGSRRWSDTSALDVRADGREPCGTRALTRLAARTAERDGAQPIFSQPTTNCLQRYYPPLYPSRGARVRIAISQLLKVDVN